MKKTAVVLLNLGGPDSREAIRPFLFNFFIDPNIIRLPYPLRWMVAKLISVRRSKKEASNSYGELGDKSPLLENTNAQATALETLLKTSTETNYKIFVSMRYWHPMADETVAAFKNWGPDQVVLLPLYPQYSTTTTRSSYQAWKKAAMKAGLSVPTKLVCCYPDENGFLKASAALIRDVYEKAAIETGQAPRLLFSAHGLPEDIVKDGDPYQAQCELSAQKMADACNIPNLDWSICYQSRVGPKKWLGPSTEEALRRAAADGVPVVIYPHAFTQEHVETLVEIELEYRELAEHLGVSGFYRVPTVGTHPDFILGLADMVVAAEGHGDIASYKNEAICPKDFSACAMRTLISSCKGSCSCQKC